MCSYSEFFWSVFSGIWTEYGPKKLRIRTLFAQYNHFLIHTNLGAQKFLKRTCPGFDPVAILSRNSKTARLLARTVVELVIVK